MYKEKFLSGNFLLLFCSMSLFFFVEYSIIAVFPVYISETLNYGRSYVGLFMGIFSASALVIKFFAGYLTDKTGRMTVFLCGMIFCIICSGFFAAASAFTALVFVRLMHGTGSGAVRAVYPALTVDIVGKESAGRGLGLIGTTCMFGMVVASPAVYFLADKTGHSIVFIILTVIGILAVIPALFIKVEKTLIPHRKLSLESFIEYKVLMPALLRFITSIWHGLFVSYAVLHSRNAGISNAGIVLTAYALGNMLVRPITGFILDKKSPGVIAWLSYALLFAGYCVFAAADGYSGVVAGGFLIGMGAGIEHTMLPTIASKIVNKDSLGRANSTLECAYSIGVVTGAVFCGKATESLPLDVLFTSVGVLNIIPALLFYLAVLKDYNKHTA